MSEDAQWPKNRRVSCRQGGTFLKSFSSEPPRVDCRNPTCAELSPPPFPNVSSDPELERSERYEKVCVCVSPRGPQRAADSERHGEPSAEQNPTERTSTGLGSAEREMDERAGAWSCLLLGE